MTFTGAFQAVFHADIRRTAKIRLRFRNDRAYRIDEAVAYPREPYAVSGCAEHISADVAGFKIHSGQIPAGFAVGCGDLGVVLDELCEIEESAVAGHDPVIEEIKAIQKNARENNNPERPVWPHRRF